MLIYIFLGVTAIIVLIGIKKIIFGAGQPNMDATQPGNYAVDGKVYHHKNIANSTDANYEIMVVDDDTIDKLFKNREIYMISEQKPCHKFVVFVNVGSTTIITTKSVSRRLYASLNDIKTAINADESLITDGPKLAQYYLCKYIIINADINRDIVNGVFQHYIVDHDLILTDE
ncbi:hypothetical protein F-E9_327 [Faustovirus]|nr:hypothetical protein F-E9_327 [Faustovirus]